jgi:hypothetical protein
MISHTSSTHGTPLSSLRPTGARKDSAAPAAAPEASTDALTTGSLDQLRSALAASPEIRPEVVAHGAKLAADPNYPPLQIIENVARQIVASEDLSHGE